MNRVVNPSSDNIPICRVHPVHAYQNYCFYVKRIDRSYDPYRWVLYDTSDGKLLKIGYAANEDEAIRAGDSNIDLLIAGKPISKMISMTEWLRYWYRTEYPGDDNYCLIRDTATFEDLFKADIDGIDVDHVIGFNNAKVRRRLLAELDRRRDCYE